MSIKSRILFFFLSSVVFYVGFFSSLSEDVLLKCIFLSLIISVRPMHCAHVYLVHFHLQILDNLPPLYLKDENTLSIGWTASPSPPLPNKSGICCRETALKIPKSVCLMSVSTSSLKETLYCIWNNIQSGDGLLKWLSQKMRSWKFCWYKLQFGWGRGQKKKGRNSREKVWYEGNFTVLSFTIFLCCSCFQKNCWHFSPTLSFSIKRSNNLFLVFSPSFFFLC